MRLGIIGGGRAAWAFGSGWQSAGRPLSGIALQPGSKSEVPERLRTIRLPLEDLVPASDLILLAVPDDAIPRLAPSLPSLGPATLLFHPSGSLTSEVFGEPDRSFSLHPLRSLPPVGSAILLAGALLVFEGTDDALTAGREVARTLGGHLVRIDAASKPLYHAAAVLASNYLAALLGAAEDLMVRSGVPRESLPSALASLAESAIGNWRTAEGSARFTGPIVRGDRATVAGHLEALADADPRRRELYRAIGAELATAVENDAENPAEVSRIIDLLRE